MSLSRKIEASSSLTTEEWRPHFGPQEMALYENSFEILYGGSRGGGKTDAGLVWMVAPIDEKRSLWEIPKYRGLVIRRNADDLSDWIDRAQYMYSGLKPEIVGKPAVIRFKSGAKIRTGHMKDENAYGKYLGHEYQRILIEECTQIPDEDRYLKLISSCRSTVDGLDSRVFLTTNPGGLGHLWVKRRFVDPAPPMTEFRDKNTGRTRMYIPARIFDNPTLMNKDPQYVNFLNGLPEPLRSAWRDGSWDVFVGQYFTRWDREVHVCQPFNIPKHWKRYRSIDYGTASASAVYWWAQDENGKSYAYRELYEANMTYEQLAKRIKEMTPESEQIDYTVVDPSICNKREQRGSQFVTGAEILGNNGVYVRAGDNSRIEGWRRVQSLLEMQKICFFSNCLRAIETIPTMVHDTNNPEDLDTDSEDHAADSVRYYVMSRPTPAVSIEEEVRFEPIPYQQRVQQYQERRRAQLIRQRRSGASDNTLGRNW